MHLPFTPNHVQLISACYPPSASLTTNGAAPNSQELSKLTYYAANKSGKLNKLGTEMEKRIKAEARKAQAGNVRSRASLLISLQILRSLATECRRDISLLTAPILSSAAITLRSMSSDLEVSAKAATLFTTWTTYTDGRLVGVDQGATADYQAILEMFSQMSMVEAKGTDHEFRNRTRLVGLAALTGAVTSEALYSSTNFWQQVPVIVSALLFNICDVELGVLEAESSRVKIESSSPYLTEFRARPSNERRAASIHIHKDGERGPSTSDLVDACLRALHSLFAQSNGSHIIHVIQAVLDSLDARQGWNKKQHCCWLATKSTEWSSYQCRYAVPTKLVERLVEDQDALSPTSFHASLTAMVTAVFTSSIHLVNLSTSDTISNLLTLVLRRVAASPDDALLAPLAECIASLGTHIYYSDQIQDLSHEIICRLLSVDANGVPGREGDKSREARIAAMRYLLSGLVGLMLAPRKHEFLLGDDTSKSSRPVNGFPNGDTAAEKAARISKRAKVTPETWQDTLHLLCDEEYAVRADYAHALAFFLRSEMAEREETMEADGTHKLEPLAEAAGRHGKDFVGTVGDESSRLLHAMHVYIFALATATTFRPSSAPTLPQGSPSLSTDVSPTPGAIVNIIPATPVDTPPAQTDRDSPLGRPSMSVSVNLRARRQSAAKKMLLHLSTQWSSAQVPVASASDYRDLLELLTVLHERIPLRGLVLGVPVLIALDSYTRGVDDVKVLNGHVLALRETLARTWLVIGRVWECDELVGMAEKALLSFPDSTHLPEAATGDATKGAFLTSGGINPIAKTDAAWDGVDPSAALNALLSRREVFEAAGFHHDTLEEHLRMSWSPQSAWQNSMEPPPGLDPLRGDSASGRMRLSPALMLSENMSLQSLARSARGVGVSDLREALEGRSSMSNPNLAVKAPSISTLDHGPGDVAHRLRPTRSRPEKGKLSDPREVKEMLNKLRIGKSSLGSSAMLKASFPSLQKPQGQAGHRAPAIVPPYKS
ncbi:hypothetical protein K488DRAFT_87530 [Vararia minispora EC-137]|uniref:Uncharacterized protein n=1 Tax=Vararia minispora EC-137 TaxID=1314806 RepID=A0ACB8QFV7_9AGAM|nr:hypothetical protein K488DRAFT_87530 [Vararia minispora EC-137]